jgi:hypothetical protein
MNKKLIIGVCMLALTTVVGLGVLNNINPEDFLAQSGSIKYNVVFKVNTMTTPPCRCARIDFNNADKVEGKNIFRTSKLAQTNFLENLPKGITDVTYYDQDQDGTADALVYNIKE